MDNDVFILLNNIKDSDDDARRAAAAELSIYATDEVLEALVSTLNDPNRGVAEAAENSLLSIRGQRIVQKIIPLLTSEKPELRNFSFEILCEIGNDSIDDIIALLKNPDHDLRKFGADILGEIISTESVDALISALDDSNINVAAAAAESLGKINDPRAIPELAKKLYSEVWMQCSVIKSLSMFNDKSSYEELCRILPDLKGMSLYSAISAIGEVGDKKAITILISLLGKKNKAFNGSVVSALEKIVSRENESTFELASYKININVLLELMSDTQIQIKLNTIKILGWLKNKDAVKPLVDEFIAVEKDTEASHFKEDIKRHIFDALVSINPQDISYIISSLESFVTPDEIKAELIDVLGKIKNPLALESMLILKDSNSKIIRKVLARALGGFNQPDSIEALKSFLKDKEGHVRGNSAKSLGKLKVESAVDDFIAVFDDEYKNIREDAVIALAAIGTVDTINKLQKVLDGTSSDEKKRLALLALGKIDSPASARILMDYLKDEDPKIRKITIEAISEHYANNYYNSLLQMLDDDNNEVKVAAIKGLSKVDALTVAKHLIDVLKRDPNLKIRYHIVEALGDLRATGATRALIELLSDQSSIIVLSAIEALGKIKDEIAVESLEMLCKSDDKDIAMTAKEAINNIEKGF